MSTEKNDPWLDAALKNVLAGRPIENISLTQPDLTTEAAYHLQHQLIKRLQAEWRLGRDLRLQSCPDSSSSTRRHGH